MEGIDEEVIWYTNPGLSNDPVRQYLNWVHKRDSPEVETKSGLIQLHSYLPDKNAWWIKHPKIGADEETPLLSRSNQALLDWNHALQQLLIMVGMDYSFYKKLRDMKEYSLLRTNMQVFQKHRANVDVCLKLIKFPRDQFYTVRGIVTKRQLDVKPLHVLSKLIRTFNKNGIVYEPYSIIATKTQTFFRFLFPQSARHLTDGTVVTFGVEASSSETCYTQPKIRMVAAFGDDNGMISFGMGFDTGRRYRDELVLLHDIGETARRMFNICGDIEKRLNKLRMTPPFIIDSATWTRYKKEVKEAIQEELSGEESMLDEMMTIARRSRDFVDNLEEMRKLEQLAGKFV